MLPGDYFSIKSILPIDPSNYKKREGVAFALYVPAFKNSDLQSQTSQSGNNCFPEQRLLPSGDMLRVVGSGEEQETPEDLRALPPACGHTALRCLHQVQGKDGDLFLWR